MPRRSGARLHALRLLTVLDTVSASQFGGVGNGRLTAAGQRYDSLGVAWTGDQRLPVSVFHRHASRSIDLRRTIFCMNPYARYTLVVAAACGAMFGAAAVGGNLLPEPHGSFVPMLVGHDFIRDENVIQKPIAEQPSPCVALFGDSRVAFNVSGEIVDRGMSDGCTTQNYAFPGLGLDQIAGLIALTRPQRAIVISVSETMVAGAAPGQSQPATWWQRLRGFDVREQVWQYALHIGAVRALYLGLHRTLRLRRIAVGQRSGDAGWFWQSRAKHWTAGIDGRVLVDLPTYRQEVEAMADNYFGQRTIGDGSEIRALLSNAKARGKAVIVVIPPSEARFRDAGER